MIMSKDLKKGEKTPTINRSKKSIYPPPSTSTHSKPTPYSIQKSEKTTSKFRIKNKPPGTQHHQSKSNSIKQERKKI